MLTAILGLLALLNVWVVYVVFDEFRRRRKNVELATAPASIPTARFMPSYRAAAHLAPVAVRQRASERAFPISARELPAEFLSDEPIVTIEDEPGEAPAEPVPVYTRYARLSTIGTRPTLVVSESEALGPVSGEWVLSSDDISVVA